MNILRKYFYYFFPQFKKSAYYVEELRQKGVQIGEGTHFFGPATTEVDVQRPWMLKIGSYCKITSGVKILTHDYSRSVLRRCKGQIIGEAAETIIGDNVFIGMNSIVLMGAHIGNNVIIGAGSVVKGYVPDNCVYAGNPAKLICTIDEYYKKRLANSKNEAVIYFNSFVKKYQREPTIAEMGPFWYLFTPRDRKILKKEKIFTSLSGDNEEELINEFLQSTPVFDSFELFKKYAFDRLNSR